MAKTPYSPLPPRMMAALTRRFLFIGSVLAQWYPTIKQDMFQADIDMHPREYMAQGFVTSLLYGFMSIPTLLVLGLVINTNLLALALGVSILIFIFMLVTVLFYPKIQGRRRTRALEENLIPALRHLLIEIRSGVPLFHSMNAVTEGYGATSDEFRKIVRQINTGEKETTAISEATRRNPSFAFRRSLWQISNALKAGSDLGQAMEAIVDDLTKEQITNIRRYGQELNPFTMIYMVAAVIMPSLGITFLVIITSFTGAVIPKLIFPLILGGLLAFQLFFMNFVSSKRPPV